jgi:hypothetical protein
MSVAAYQDLKGYKSAIKDVILRILFALIILAGGYWIPSLYFDRFPILSLYGPGDLAEAAFTLSKLAAIAYGVMGMWSVHIAIEALWHPRTNREAQPDGST